MNSLNLLHILVASLGFFLTLSRRFDCASTNGVEATTKKDRIAVVNKLYDEGHYIIYMTARAMGRNKHLSNDEATTKAKEIVEPLTKMQLDIWGCKYQELIFGKPHADMFIDDKAWTDFTFFNDKK